MTGLAHDLLATTARRIPDHPALLTDRGPHRFGEIDRASDCFASALQRSGVIRGDRVAIMMESTPELVITIFGVLRSGGVFVVVNPTTKAEKLAFVLEDSGARVLVCGGGRLAHEARAALRNVDSVAITIWTDDVPPDVPNGHELAALMMIGAGSTPHAPSLDDPGLGDPGLDDPGLIDADLAAIIYTSGSTGVPKGVMLTHRNVCHNVWSIATYLRNTPDDVVACLLPLSFNYGLFQVLVGVYVGYTVLLERSFAYPYDVLRRVAEHGVTGLPGVPTVFSTILDLAPLDAFDLSKIRYLTNAGAALPPAHLARLQQLFPSAEIFSMYGQTECTRICYLDPALVAEKPDSVGRAIPNTEAYVIDDEGRRVGPGIVGELVVRGAHVMRGYWGKPEETARVLRDGEIPGEKVLHTGDRFRTDDEGCLYFVGRSDDVFKCKGEKIAPKEIEFVLYELDEVGEAAVVPVPDEHDGMAIKAVVVPSGRGVLDEQLVRRHCRTRLESYMVPKLIEVRGSLPKTESGKIKKTSLI